MDGGVEDCGWGKFWEWKLGVLFWVCQDWESARHLSEDAQLEQMNKYTFTELSRVFDILMLMNAM